MGLRFTHSPRPTVGIELELMLVHRATRELVDEAPSILAALQDDPVLGACVKQELFAHTLELVSSKSDSVPQAMAELERNLHRLRAVVGQRDLMLVSAGIHPFSHATDHAISDEPRYQAFVNRSGLAVREMQTLGMHVHVGVPDGDAAIRAMNVGTMYAPLMLALTASSPFVDGKDSGLQSVRKSMFERLEFAELPRPFTKWREFEDFYEQLRALGVISGTNDIWWHERANHVLGTCEGRACDAPAPLSDASLPDPLEVRTGEFRQMGEVERENMSRAARWDLSAELLLPQARKVTARGLAIETCELLLPVAERLGCASELQGVHDIVRNGTSAHRQRAILASGGGAFDVVDALAMELETGRRQMPVGWVADADISVKAGTPIPLRSASSPKLHGVGPEVAVLDVSWASSSWRFGPANPGQ